MSDYDGSTDRGFDLDDALDLDDAPDLSTDGWPERFAKVPVHRRSPPNDHVSPPMPRSKRSQRPKRSSVTD